MPSARRHYASETSCSRLGGDDNPESRFMIFALHVHISLFAKLPSHRPSRLNGRALYGRVGEREFLAVRCTCSLILGLDSSTTVSFFLSSRLRARHINISLPTQLAELCASVTSNEYVVTKGPIECIQKPRVPANRFSQAPLRATSGCRQVAEVTRAKESGEFIPH